MEERSFQQLYEEMHQQNRKRIRGGLICIFVIPLVFLFLMFISDSSKIFFLVLWIVSIFAVSIYLITVEYIDYLMQQRAFFGEQSAREQESLIDITGTLEEKLKEQKRREKS